MRAQQASEAVLIERIASAGVPRRKTDKRMQEAERDRQGERLDVANLVENREEIRQQPCDRNPGEEVNDDAPTAAENWVHFRA